MLLHAQNVVLLQVESLLRNVRQLVTDLTQRAQASIFEIRQCRLHLLILALAAHHLALRLIDHLIAQLIALILRGT